MKRLREMPDLSKASAEFRRLNPHLSGNMPICTNAQIGIKKVCAEKHIDGKSGPRKEKRINLNGTEQRMLDYLRARERRGDIANVRPFPLILHWGLDGDGHYMTYTPDMSYDREGRTVLVEVKGAHVRSRDIVRFKGCRAEWDGKFGFEMWQWKEREWTRIL